MANDHTEQQRRVTNRDARTAESIALRSMQREIIRTRNARVRECARRWASWNGRKA